PQRRLVSWLGRRVRLRFAGGECERDHARPDRPAVVLLVVLQRAVRIFAEALSSCMRRIEVALSSVAVGGLTSAHRPGSSRPLNASSARLFSATTVTAVARPRRRRTCS